jgi:hypothetical protein
MIFGHLPEIWPRLDRNFAEFSPDRPFRLSAPDASPRLSGNRLTYDIQQQSFDF